MTQTSPSIFTKVHHYLDHQEVLLDLSVVREASHGVDGLVGQVIVSGGVVLDQLALLHLVTLTDSVDLLVDLSSVMVTLLTSSRHSVLDPAGMPSSNTSDLNTSMNLFESEFSLLIQDQ